MFRFTAFSLMFVAAASADAQEMRVGAVDLYGLRTVAEARVREAIVVGPADVLDLSGNEPPAALSESRRRLLAVPGVADVHVSTACCHDGRWVVFFGIEEEGAPVLRFREPSQGAVRLPGGVIGAYEEFLAALTASVQRGNFPEDRSQGHALSEDPALRAVQERFPDLAARHLPRLRSSLRESADASHRAAAAHVLGDAPDKARSALPSPATIAR